MSTHLVISLLFRQLYGLQNVGTRMTPRLTLILAPSPFFCVLEGEALVMPFGYVHKVLREGIDLDTRLSHGLFLDKMTSRAMSVTQQRFITIHYDFKTLVFLRIIARAYRRASSHHFLVHVLQ